MKKEIASSIEWIQMADRGWIIRFVGIDLDRSSVWVDTLIKRFRANTEAMMPFAEGIVLFVAPNDLLQMEMELRRIDFESLSVESNQTERILEIPVCYGEEWGPDLEEISRQSGRSVESWIEQHTSTEFVAEQLGFMLGFAYLTGLDPAFHVPRRTSPRAQLPAGAVAIGGPYTGIYPTDSPGGWHWIGQTPLWMVWPDREPMTRIQWRDRIRFVRINAQQFRALQHREQQLNDQLSFSQLDQRFGVSDSLASQRLIANVIHGGGICILTDLGRPDAIKYGVSWGGAMDPLSAQLANLLVGNQKNAPVLEVLWRGPTLAFITSCQIGWYGPPVDCWINGRFVRISGGCLSMEVGDQLKMGTLEEGARGYLSVTGGWNGERWLGSYSTFLRISKGGLFGGILKTGMILEGLTVDFECDQGYVLPPMQATRQWLVAYDKQLYQSQPRRLRVVIHPTLLKDERELKKIVSCFAHAIFRVSITSDRMGIRLIPHEGLQESLVLPQLERSIPVCAGTVQVPPNGEPILLMADAQPTGGYPVIGQVIRADLGLAAMVRPGESISFEVVSESEAIVAWDERMAWLQDAQIAIRLFGLRTGVEEEVRFRESHKSD